MGGKNTQFVLSVLYALTISEVTAGEFAIGCPPELPNFESMFKRSLENSRLRSIFEEIKREIFSPTENCITSQTLDSFNQDRCSGNASLDRLCTTTTSTAPPTTTITTTASSSEPTSSAGTKLSLNTITEAPLSNTIFTTPTVQPSQKATQTTEKDSTKHRAPTQSVTTSGISSSGTTKSISLTYTTSGRSNKTIDPRREINATPPMGHTKASTSVNPLILYIPIVGGVIAVVFLIILIYACRKKFYKGNHLPKVTAGRDHHGEWDVQISQLKFDSLTPNGNIHQGMKSDPVMAISDNRWNENHENSKNYYVNNNTEDFHSNTLRMVNHAHALNPGGFGESNTDSTLPRSLQRKSRPKTQETKIHFIDGHNNIDHGSMKRPIEHIYDTPYEVCDLPQTLTTHSSSDSRNPANYVGKQKKQWPLQREVSVTSFKGDETSTIDRRWSMLESASSSRDSGYQSPIYRTVSQISGYSDNISTTDSQTTLIGRSSNESLHVDAQRVNTLPKQSSTSTSPRKAKKPSKEFKQYDEGWIRSLNRDPREKYKDKKKNCSNTETFIYTDKHYDL